MKTYAAKTPAATPENILPLEIAPYYGISLLRKQRRRCALPPHSKTPHAIISRTTRPCTSSRAPRSGRSVTRGRGQAGGRGRSDNKTLRQQKKPASDGGPRLSNAPPWDRAANGPGLSRLPFTSPPLAFGFLRRIDHELNDRNVVLGVFIALRPGQQKPLVSFGFVLRHTLAIAIHAAEVGLGFGISLVCRLAKPLHRFGFVLRHTSAIGIHDAEVGLGRGMSLVCRLAIPLHRFGFVLRHTLAIESRCKPVSVICPSSLQLHPFGVRRSEGERSEPSAAEPQRGEVAPRTENWSRAGHVGSLLGCRQTHPTPNQT